MKVAILIHKNKINSYENLKFRQVAIKEGINLKFIFTCDVSIVYNNDKIEIYDQGKVIENIDILIPRVGSGLTKKNKFIIDSFEKKGIRVINNGSDIEFLMNKLSVQLFLYENQIPFLKSMVIDNITNVELVEKNLSYPLIKKSTTGSLGLGIYKINNQEELFNLINHSKLLDKDYFYFLQELNTYKPGEDIRVWMYKDNILGAMKRTSLGDDFKSNYAIHQSAESVEVDKKLEDICKKIQEKIKIDILGIDILETKDGYVVCEINSAPGFEGLEKVNPGLNIAKELFLILRKEQ